MNQTRAGRYGNNLAAWVDYTITTIPESQRQSYKSLFLKEIKAYSFEPEHLSRCNIKNPKDLAKIVKEGINLMYQKKTARRAIESLIESLSQGFPNSFCCLGGF